MRLSASSNRAYGDALQIRRQVFASRVAVTIYVADPIRFAAEKPVEFAVIGRVPQRPYGIGAGRVMREEVEAVSFGHAYGIEAISLARGEKEGGVGKREGNGA